MSPIPLLSIGHYALFQLWTLNFSTTQLKWNLCGQVSCKYFSDEELVFCLMKLIRNLMTHAQQNSYTCYLLGKMATQLVDSDSVDFIVNCQQHGDYTVTINCVVTMLPTVVNSYYTITVQSLCIIGDWWNRNFNV